MNQLSGIMSVYLQGKAAILDFQVLSDRFEGFIGGKESRIQVVDYRKTTLLYCNPKTSSRDLSPLSFADVFNLPANVVVEETDEGDVTVTLKSVTESDLHEDKKLWLGVIWDEQLSVQKFFWETLRPVQINSESAVAFASVIEWTKE